MTPPTSYTAVRITDDSDHDFVQTRGRFDERVPVLDPAVTLELVKGRATWAEVEASISGRSGPEEFTALARLDQGALFSLSGRPLEASLYLVGNPLLAPKLSDFDPAAMLYAPFRVRSLATTQLRMLLMTNRPACSRRSVIGYRPDRARA